MRIGIVALNFKPGQIGGVETYFRTLLEQLQQNDARNEYIVFLPEGLRGCIQITNAKFRVIEMKISRNAVGKLIYNYGFTEKLGYYSKQARQIDGLCCDLLHFPIQFMSPLDVKTPSIVSCMDIQHEYFPQFFTTQQLFVRRMIYKPSLVRAKHVITISDFVKNAVWEKYRVAKKQMTTVHLCFSENLFNGYESAQTHFTKLPSAYFYYPAATWPHKNHKRLLHAFSEVLKKYSDVSLVLSGISVQKKSFLEQMVVELDLVGKVQVLGYIKYSEILRIYKNAVALVFPSLYEGFGLPVIEAMHAGCPVLCSGTTALPEIAGKAAMYFDPLDVDDIAGKLLHILDSPIKRKKLITEGKKNAARFSGSKLARETIAVYEKFK